jgi:hypothetical protein
MLNNSITNLNNYVRTVNSSINYLNNATANIRYMQEHINYYYHINNLQLITNNNSAFARENANSNSNSHSNSQSQSNSNSELTYEYFEELSLRNLKTIIAKNITECLFETLNEPLNESCSITHEEFTPQHNVSKINVCGHIFNTKAINEWLIDHHSCPNCRYNILTNSNIISYNDQELNKTFFFNIDELITFFCFIHQSS